MLSVNSSFQYYFGSYSPNDWALALKIWWYSYLTFLLVCYGLGYRGWGSDISERACPVPVKLSVAVLPDTSPGHFSQDSTMLRRQCRRRKTCPSWDGDASHPEKQEI